MRKRRPASQPKSVVSAKQAVAALFSTKNDVQAEIDALLIKKEELVAENKKMELKLSNLGDLMEDSTKMHGKIKKKVEDVVKTFGDVTEDLFKAEDELDKVEKANEAALEKYKGQLSVIEKKSLAKIEKAEKHLSLVKSETEKADAVLVALKAEFNKIEMDLSKKKDEKKSVSSDIVSLKEHRSSLEAKIKDDTSSSNGLAKTLTELYKKVGDTRSESEQEFGKLKAIVEDLNERLSDKKALDKKIADARLVLLTLDKRIKTVEKRENEVKALYKKAGVPTK